MEELRIINWKSSAEEKTKLPGIAGQGEVCRDEEASVQPRYGAHASAAVDGISQHPKTNQYTPQPEEDTYAARRETRSIAVGVGMLKMSLFGRN